MRTVFSLPRDPTLFVDYVRIARPDHWFKNVFMLPGVAVAIFLVHAPPLTVIAPVLIGLVSTSLVASANYVINEWLDREFDRHHPLKHSRPSVVGRVRASYVAMEYALLAGAGLLLALGVSTQFVVFSIVLLLMGFVYNVQPLRTKDREYLDVLSESVNNPLRFLLGWSTVSCCALPPSSVLLAYWMGGAFLMAMKRFAEYRFIGNAETAGLYRRSFQYYSEEKLLVSAFFYALCSAFFLGIFLIKYRIEFLLSFPLFALLFSWYLAISLKSKSAAQAPEKLYTEKKFVAFVIVLAIVVTALMFIDIRWLDLLLVTNRY